MRKFKLLKPTVKSKASDIFDENLRLNGNNEIVYSNGVEIYTLKEIENNSEWFEEIIEKKWNWEKSFDETKDGYYINNHGELCLEKSCRFKAKNYSIFKNRHQAEGFGKAAAQLTHIVEKANTLEDGTVWDVNEHKDWFYTIKYDVELKELKIATTSYKDPLLNFYSEEIAKEVLNDNLELIKCYCNVK